MWIMLWYGSCRGCSGVAGGKVLDVVAALGRAGAAVVSGVGSAVVGTRWNRGSGQSGWGETGDSGPRGGWGGGRGRAGAGAGAAGRGRRVGGGPRRAADVDPGLRPALLALIEPDVRGDPMSPLRWTTKSTRTLAAE